MRSNRKTILYGGLAAMAVLYGGDSGYRKIETVIERKQNDLDRLQKQLNQVNDEFVRAVATIKQLDSLEARSLPRDLDLARSRYRAWLVQLVQDAGLRNPTVDSGDSVNQKNLYYQLAFSVRGRGTLAQITRFLFDFYQAGYLHKIASVSLTPGSSGQIELAVSIEAISLPTAAEESELASVESNRLAWNELSRYDEIMRRDIFGQGGADSVARNIVLSAITSDTQGRREAWFRIGPDAPTQIKQAGDELVRDSIRARIVEVRPDGVLLEIDGQSRQMAVGENLAEARPVVSTHTVARQPRDVSP